MVHVGCHQWCSLLTPALQWLRLLTCALCLDDAVLGAGVNIARVPYDGRNFEYLGEDPFLAGRMASEIITGAQSEPVETPPPPPPPPPLANKNLLEVTDGLSKGGATQSISDLSMR